MKIGILTLHNQINYGGVLQAYALQECLREQGYSVQILNKILPGLLLEKREQNSYKQSIRRYIYQLGGLKPDLFYERIKRTKQFINKKLILSKIQFTNWKDINNKELDVDCIVVGSDQVWHLSNENNLKCFLLIDAPSIPAISYAASIGMPTIPNEAIEIYKNGLKNFKAISIRENEGVKLLSQLGFHAIHVVDPTLLLSFKKWYEITNWQKYKEKRLFCYFMTDTWLSVFPILQKYAKQTNSIIDIFFNDGVYQAGFLTHSKSIVSWIKWINSIFTKDKKIIIHLDASPEDFLQYASLATEAVSDSYHALMFSIIFKLNVRILSPKIELRKRMFSRIKEFEQYVSSGTLIFDDLNSALISLEKDNPVRFNEEKIVLWKQTSIKWLIEQLNEISKHLKS